MSRKTQVLDRVQTFTRSLVLTMTPRTGTEGPVGRNYRELTYLTYHGSDRPNSEVGIARVTGSGYGYKCLTTGGTVEQLHKGGYFCQGKVLYTTRLTPSVLLPGVSAGTDLGVLDTDTIHVLKSNFLNSIFHPTYP